MAAAEQQIDHKADNQPHKESQPGHQRQARHQKHTAGNRQQRHQRNKWRPEASRAFRLLLTEYDHRRRDDDECEQRADVRELGEGIDVPYSRRESDYEARDPGTDVRCLENAMDAGEDVGNKPSRDMANQILAWPY